MVEKATINLVIPALKDAGATDLLEIPIAKDGELRGEGHTMPRGTVIEFNEYVGLGEVEGGTGARYLFHCVEIADGTRTIEIGTEVDFDLLRKFGRDEAAKLRPAG